MDLENERTNSNYCTMAEITSTEIQELAYLTKEKGKKAGFPGQFYLGKQHGGEKQWEGYPQGFFSC